MADTPVVHIGENSPKQVAFKLLGLVAQLDGKKIIGVHGAGEPPTREWLLDTYAECIEAVRGHRSVKKKT
ncbi:hypothetical protein V5F53_14095 [Xanthobacter sp. V4C-4]|uniref:hypothetical protein n=1 Tax=Xanthobacter cornucopiae TaxID=3119924 RepID=UPI00372A11C2